MSSPDSTLKLSDQIKSDTSKKFVSSKGFSLSFHDRLSKQIHDVFQIRQVHFKNN
jgi:hypothetical protein